MKAQEIPYKKYTPCTFSVELPTTMEMYKMYEDSSPDYCDYEVKLKDGTVIMEIHSLIKSRFEYTSMEDLYAKALLSSELTITYKKLNSNYFVISGLDKKNGNIVYWKRVLGENFISDMRIEYDNSRKNDIEPFIEKISKSFTSN
jgi:hypothetical protein